MTHFGKHAFACALFASGLFAASAQAFVTPGQTGGQKSADTARPVIQVHNSHTDCQKDNGGSHWHKGLKNKRIGCPGGKK